MKKLSFNNVLSMHESSLRFKVQTYKWQSSQQINFYSKHLIWKEEMFFCWFCDMSMMWMYAYSKRWEQEKAQLTQLLRSGYTQKIVAFFHSR